MAEEKTVFPEWLDLEGYAQGLSNDDLVDISAAYRYLIDTANSGGPLDKMGFTQQDVKEAAVLVPVFAQEAKKRGLEAAANEAYSTINLAAAQIKLENAIKKSKESRLKYEAIRDKRLAMNRILKYTLITAVAVGAIWGIGKLFFKKKS